MLEPVKLLDPSGSISLMYEITPDGGTVELGCCVIRFLPKSVSKTHDVKFTLSMNDRGSPDLHVPASATLTCEPSTIFRKAVHIQLPTWFLTQKSVDVSIYTKQPNCEWIELDSAALTDEKIFDIQLKELNNITAFLHKRSLPDVNFMMKPCLYRKDVGCFNAVFGYSDEVSSSCIKCDMEREGYDIVVDKMKEINAAFGDEIQYTFSPGDKSETQSYHDELRGQITISEGYFENSKGYSRMHDLSALCASTQSTFTIKQIRNDNGKIKIIFEESFIVVFHPNGDSTRQTNIEFLGSFQAENVFGDVGDVKIDQRVIVDNTKFGMSHKNNAFTYQEPRKIASNPTQQVSPRLKTVSGRANKISNIKFLGNVRVKNLIGNAGNVTIDQRMIYKNQHSVDDNPPTKIAVQPENDFPGPLEPQDDPMDDKEMLDEIDDEVEEKDANESMIGSDRAFTSVEESAQH